MPAARLGLLDHRDGDFPETLEKAAPPLRVIGQELEDPVGACQPGGPPADDQDADLDDLVLAVEPTLDELVGRLDRRRVGRRYRRAVLAPGHRDQLPFLAFTASVSLGRILFRSPTMPRSENSKIGAFASLLIATMFSEFCMPTLCWIAPEMPAAR